MGNFVIETKELQKSFKGHSALRGLNLSVPSGSIFGFLGRNGAGKTTTIKLLLGLLKADAGSMRVLGSEIRNPDDSIAVRRRIGFVSEEKDLYPFMTVKQIIAFTKPFFETWSDDAVERYLAMFDLPLNKSVETLSKGGRSKLMLLLALSHKADLLVLDEPTDGLDPAASEDMLRELVAIAASQNTTIFFSSHHLAEVEQIADQICIIDKGRSIVAGALDDLKVRYQRLQIVFDSQVQTPGKWVDGVESVVQEGRVVSLLVSRNIDAVVDQARSLSGSRVERSPVGLKEIFLEHVRSN